MSYIFISYSSKKATKVENFKKIMEENGIQCWMAPNSIELGSNYGIAIPNAIKDCGAFVLLLSNESQASIWVPKELDAALNCKKEILPVFIENCELIPPFNFYLSNVQSWNIATKKSENIKKVIDRIKQILKIDVDTCETKNAASEKNIKYNDDNIHIETEKTNMIGRGTKEQARTEPFDASLLLKVLAYAVKINKISVPLIQHEFAIGYAHAARIIDELEGLGYIGYSKAGDKYREVRVTREMLRDCFGIDVSETQHKYDE